MRFRERLQLAAIRCKRGTTCGGVAVAEAKKSDFSSKTCEKSSTLETMMFLFICKDFQTGFMVTCAVGLSHLRLVGIMSLLRRDGVHVQGASCKALARVQMETAHRCSRSHCLFSLTLRDALHDALRSFCHSFAFATVTALRLSGRLCLISKTQLCSLYLRCLHVIDEQAAQSTDCCTIHGLQVPQVVLNLKEPALQKQKARATIHKAILYRTNTSRFAK